MSLIPTDFPWYTQGQADEIARAFNNNHAVLLSGAQGIGKSHLACMLINSLFADSSSAEKKLLDAGTHPDVHVLCSAYAYRHLAPMLQKLCLRYLDPEAIEKKRLSRQIGIDSIRALTEAMSEASSSGGCKLTIIYPAEHLNINSANAILKFLEEPTARTYLVLISHDISRLTATIRSRCMRVNIELPDSEISSQWLSSIYPDHTKKQIAEALALSGSRPLLAAEYLSANQQSLVGELESDIYAIASDHTNNIVAIARKWARHKQTDFILGWVCRYFASLIKVKLEKMAGHDCSESNQDSLTMSDSFSSQHLFDIYDYLISLNQMYDGIVDEMLIIEDVLQTIAKNKL